MDPRHLCLEKLVVVEQQGPSVLLCGSTLIPLPYLTSHVLLACLPCDPTTNRTESPRGPGLPTPLGNGLFCPRGDRKNAW